MSLVTRYILRETAVPAALALAVIGFIGMGARVRGRLEQFDLGFVLLSDMARLLFYLLPTVAAFIIPIAYMMGILMAFGRFSQQNEIIAMRAAGIPLWRLTIPVILGGALLSTGTFWLQEVAQPWGWARVNQLIFRDLPLRSTIDVVPTGKMHRFGDVHVYIGSRDSTAQTLHDVEILQVLDTGGTQLYHADTARVRTGEGQSTIHIESGYALLWMGGGNLVESTLDAVDFPLPPLEPKPYQGIRRTLSIQALFERERFLTFLKDLGDEDVYIEGLMEQLSREGWSAAAVPEVPAPIQAQYPEPFRLDAAAIDSIDPARARDVRRELMETRREIAERWSRPLACLAVSIVAAPLGIRAQRGGRSYSFAIGFAVLLVYYTLWTLGQPYTLRSLQTIVVNLMVPNAVLIAAGAWFLWRVDRP